MNTSVRVTIDVDPEDVWRPRDDRQADPTNAEREREGGRPSGQVHSTVK